MLFVGGQKTCSEVESQLERGIEVSQHALAMVHSGDLSSLLAGPSPKEACRLLCLSALFSGFSNAKYEFRKGRTEPLSRHLVQEAIKVQGTPILSPPRFSGAVVIVSLLGTHFLSRLWTLQQKVADAEAVASIVDSITILEGILEEFLLGEMHSVPRLRLGGCSSSSVRVVDPENPEGCADQDVTPLQGWPFGSAAGTGSFLWQPCVPVTNIQRVWTGPGSSLLCWKTICC